MGLRPTLAWRSFLPWQRSRSLLGCLIPSLVAWPRRCRAVVCAGGKSRRPDSGRPRKPRNGECAGRVRRRRYGASRNRQNLPGRPAGLPRTRSESAYLSAPAHRPNPSHLARSVGLARPQEPRRPVRSLQDPLGPAWNSVGSSALAAGAPPDDAAAGKVVGSPSELPLRSLSVGGAVVCGTLSLSFLPVGTRVRFVLFFS